MRARLRVALPLWAYRYPRLRYLASVTLWRALERDTGLQPDTYGSPSYAYGKVTELDIRVMTETTESPYVCCGYCSAGMVCRVVKPSLSNKMANTAHPIRSASGRPHDAGSNATELRNGSKAAHGVTLEALAVNEVIVRLEAGYAAEVALDYDRLPAYLQVQSGSFGHSVMLAGWKAGDMVGFFDPLWPQDAYGAWAKWSELKPALWSDGNHNGATVKGASAVGNDTVYASAGVTSGKVAAVKAGQVWWKDGEGLDKGGEFGSAASVVYLGTVNSDNSKQAVIANTGNVYADGQPRPTIVYVTGAVVSDAPASPAGDELAIRRAEWDRYSAGLGVPPRP